MLKFENIKGQHGVWRMYTADKRRTEDKAVYICSAKYPGGALGVELTRNIAVPGPWKDSSGMWLYELAPDLYEAFDLPSARGFSFEAACSYHGSAWKTADYNEVLVVRGDGQREHWDVWGAEWSPERARLNPNFTSQKFTRITDPAALAHYGITSLPEERYWGHSGEYLRKFGTERPDRGMICRECGDDWIRHSNSTCPEKAKPDPTVAPPVAKTSTRLSRAYMRKFGNPDPSEGDKCRVCGEDWGVHFDADCDGKDPKDVRLLL